jgi:restriction system protein
MEVPTHAELFNPTLAALRKLGGSASINELTETVVADLQLPSGVVQQPHGDRNQTELEYRLAWARSYLKIYGLVNNSERGIWALTGDGISVQTLDPNDVIRFVQQRHKDQKPNTPAGAVLVQASEETGEEAESWKETILESLSEMHPSAFERLCQRMLRESGFIEVEVTGKSGDGGIDGHGIIRVAGLISFPVLFQCKRQRTNIGSATVRDFRGAMIGRADKGLVITTGGFTSDARQEATRDGAPPIDLIDGDLLATKLKELKLGVATRMVEVVDVDTEWFSSI